MRKLFQIALIAALFVFVACGGGKSSKNSCPDGYEWSGTDCVKKGSSIDGGDSEATDTTPQSDDGDTADDSGDTEDDGETDDSDSTDSGSSDDYKGSCKVIHSGDEYEINIETKKLKIGTVTVNGSADLTKVYGELWGMNKSALSEFKIGDIKDIAGKEFNLPKGKYEFSYKPVYKDGEKVISGSKIVFADSEGKPLDDIDISSGDKTLDLDIPLYHLKGKVLNNSGADFTAVDESQPQLTLASGSFEKVIPYSEFGSYDILLPKGTYSVYFKGRLLAGVDFEGTVLSGVATLNNTETPEESEETEEPEGSEASDEDAEVSEEEAVSDDEEVSDDEAGSGSGDTVNYDGAIVVEGDSATIEKNIEIKTIRFSGSIVMAEGAAEVTSGSLVLVENPPLGSVNTVVVADLSAETAYDVTVTAGATLNLLYLPAADSYPRQYIALETWSDATENPGSHNIVLDFAKVHGKLTFMGGKTFPSISKCVPKECSGDDDQNCVIRECTIGKLKVQYEDDSSSDGFLSSYLLKDLGSELVLDDDGNVAFEAFLPRKRSSGVAKEYKMIFESHLNDVAEVFDSNPFILPATYKNGEITTSSFSFSKTEVDGTETWLNAKPLDDLDVAPSKVSGKITVDGSPVDVKTPDVIKLKYDDGEHTVAVLSELSQGSFSFYAPMNKPNDTSDTYDVVYEGKGILGKDFKTYVERGFRIEGDTTKDFAMKTGRITLDFKVNGTPFAEWAESQKGLQIGLAVNVDMLTLDYSLDLVENDGQYSAKVFAGSILNANLELAFDDKVESEKSYLTLPLLNKYSMDSNKSVTTDLTLVDFSVSVKLNGKNVSASKYAAELEFSGNSKEKAKIFCPATSAVKVFLPEKEYRPEVSLNEGFGTKQEIEVPCVYFDK